MGRLTFDMLLKYPSENVIKRVGKMGLDTLRCENWWEIGVCELSVSWL